MQIGYLLIKLVYNNKLYNKQTICFACSDCKSSSLQKRAEKKKYFL